MEAFLHFIGAAAGLLYILEYFGVTPSNLRFGQRRLVRIDAVPALRKDLRFWTVLALLIVNLGFFAYQVIFGPKDTNAMDVTSPMDIVDGQKFLNETVEVDGKKFIQCRFDNVRLLFHVRKSFAFERNYFGGAVVLETDNAIGREAILVVIRMMREANLLDPGVRLDSHNGIVLNPKYTVVPPAPVQQ